MGGALPLVDY